MLESVSHMSLHVFARCQTTNDSFVYPFLFTVIYTLMGITASQ